MFVYVRRRERDLLAIKLNLRTIKRLCMFKSKGKNSTSASGAQRMKSRPLDRHISLGLPHSYSEDRRVKQGFVCVLLTFIDSCQTACAIVWDAQELLHDCINRHSVLKRRPFFLFFLFFVPGLLLTDTWWLSSPALCPFQWLVVLFHQRLLQDSLCTTTSCLCSMPRFQSL